MKLSYVGIKLLIRTHTRKMSISVNGSGVDWLFNGFSCSKEQKHQNHSVGDSAVENWIARIEG